MPQLVTCLIPGCPAEFFFIPERGGLAYVCIDHAADARRQVDGYDPATAVD